MNETKYLSITAITRYLKYQIDNDENLQDVYLKGEISNFKAHSRGHFYFTLKDETSRISAIMFSSNTTKLTFTPEDGMKVLIRGKISVYEATGNYQIYVSDMQEDGIGNLYIAFEKLKLKLEKEGLFDKTHKKQIPKIPSRIGIVTAPTGAAIRDILSTIKRRFPICETILFPALVQGPDAHTDIVKQIKKAEEFDIDVLIIGRGGGSIEDLWPFNEEDVARAIYNCKMPTISAVGHEIDYTISDFVADVRAATPTGAAEIAVPNMVDLLNTIDSFKIRASKVVSNKIDNLKITLSKLKDSYVLNNPLHIYQVKEQRLDGLIDKLNSIILNITQKRNDRLNSLLKSYVLNNPKKLFENKNYILSKYIEKLEVLNPLNTLKRGYTIVKKDNKAIDKLNKLKQNDEIEIMFNKGTINATVISIKEN
ncbi:MAG TPA: exodeoxyribonuclease VII large subunit [Mollicutes bacterium]|nr:exodeoxyribonuclease VII large subunit [Mollicutes bacterium]